MKTLGKKGTLFLLSLFVLLLGSCFVGPEKFPTFAMTLGGLFSVFCGSNVVATHVTANVPPKDPE